MIIHLDVATYKAKTWLAELTGLDPKRGFEREFTSTISRDTSKSGATGSYTYEVDDGLYEASNGRYGREYFIIEQDQRRDLDGAEDAVQELKRRAATPTGPTPEQAAVRELADAAYDALDTPTGEKDQQEEMTGRLNAALDSLRTLGLYPEDNEAG